MEMKDIFTAIIAALALMIFMFCLHLLGWNAGMKFQAQQLKQEEMEK